MNCRTVERRIGSVNRPESVCQDEMIGAHISNCSDCAAYLRSRVRVLELLRSLHDSDVAVMAPDVDEQMHQRYRRYTSRKSSNEVISQSHTGLLWMGISVGAMSLILVIAWLTTFRVGRPEGNQGLMGTPVIAQSGNHDHLRGEQKRDRGIEEQPAIRRQQQIRVGHSVQLSGFKPVFFCDALACSGPLQTIRIQTENPISGGRSGKTDLLVGMDGIVRAVRISN